MTCCANQRVMISERTGRMFCDSCRTYLDNPPTPQEPPEGAEPEDASDDAAAQEGDPE